MRHLLTAPFGTPRRIAAVRRFGRDRSEADMPRASEAGRSDENDPKQTLVAIRSVGHLVCETCLAVYSFGPRYDDCAGICGASGAVVWDPPATAGSLSLN